MPASKRAFLFVLADCCACFPSADTLLNFLRGGVCWLLFAMGFAQTSPHLAPIESRCQGLHNGPLIYGGRVYAENLDGDGFAWMGMFVCKQRLGC